nr:hypothetical protein CFP56_04262 [Quercus suber]
MEHAASMLQPNLLSLRYCCVCEQSSMGSTNTIMPMPISLPLPCHLAPSFVAQPAPKADAPVLHHISPIERPQYLASLLSARCLLRTLPSLLVSTCEDIPLQADLYTYICLSLQTDRRSNDVWSLCVPTTARDCRQESGPPGIITLSTPSPLNALRTPPHRNAIVVPRSTGISGPGTKYIHQPPLGANSPGRISSRPSPAKVLFLLGHQPTLQHPSALGASSHDTGVTEPANRQISVLSEESSAQDILRH